MMAYHVWEINPGLNKIGVNGKRKGGLWNVFYPTPASWERVRRSVLRYAGNKPQFSLKANNGTQENCRFVLTV